MVNGQAWLFHKSKVGEIANGLDAIGKLQECDALLSGYLGSAEQVDKIIYALEKNQST